LVLPQSKFLRREAKVAFLNAVAERLRSVPGVTAAATVSALPMEGVGGIGLAIAPDESYDNAHRAMGLYLMATPGYFATMGATLRGEDLPSTFDSTHKVVVINSALAKQMWPNADAIGHRIRFGNERRTVIGVVNDIRTGRLDTAALGQMYLPMAEQPQSYASIVVRGTATNAAMIAHVRDAVHSVDPTQPVYALQSMSDVISTSVAPRRTNTVLLSLFGALAVVLAAVGVYAVLSYSVTQRTREIGVRVALGAQRNDVVRLIVRQGAVLSVTGIVLGLAGAFALSRFVGALLYEVDPHDPRIFIGAPVLLGLVAIVAMLTPAMRATRVDPLTALRED
jgi:predicted permease